MLKKILLRFIIILSKHLDQKQTVNLINILSNKKNINILLTAYRIIGLHKVDFEWGGEKNFIENLLPKYLGNSLIKKKVLFDVGANIGNYSNILSGIYKDSIIYAFEPTKKVFENLKRNTQNIEQIQPINVALGNKLENRVLYKKKHIGQSAHNTLYGDVISDLHNSDEVETEHIKVTTINNFCKSNNIQHIDFLKIDTEGNDYFVLEGAKELLTNNKIKVIQFEFNEMNIVSRVFLRDFYKLLPQYDFFRINTNELIPLGKYNSFNEIFQFQNIVAINKYTTV